MIEAEYLRDQHVLRQSQQGYQLTVGYLARVPAGVSVDEALYRVLEDGNLPKRGDPHPRIPGIFAVERRAEALDSETVRITVEFAVPSAEDPIVRGVSRIQFGSSAASETTALDVSGQPIITQLEVPFIDDSGNPSTRIDIQAHNVDVERPATTAIFERLEPQSPQSRALVYVGRVNSLPWYGGGAGEWLCTGIEGDSEDGGETYRVVYSFQYRQGGHNPIIRHRDPETGLPVNPSVFRPGAVIQAVVYRAANFSALDLLT
jgi:hypothetical protein